MSVLSPQEAISRFKEEVPEDVIECWNDELVSNLIVSGNKLSSHCLYNNISKRIQQKMNVSENAVEKNGWLDLEDIFRDKGWKVSTDCPGYNESYSANVIFTATK